MTDWQPIETAPERGTYFVRTDTRPAGFLVTVEDGFVDADGQDVTSWCAVNEADAPPCWTGGAYWQSNADEVQSDPPNHWRPAPPQEKG